MRTFNVYATDADGREWLVEVNARTSEQALYAARATVATKGGLAVAIEEGRAQIAREAPDAMDWRAKERAYRASRAVA